MTDERIRSLRRWNLGAGILHLAQGILVVILSNGFSLPVTATFLADAPGLQPPRLVALFELDLGWGVATFLFLSALAHFLIVSPAVFDRYVAQLERRRNYARWIEYSLSASVMVVLIAMLTGISDIAALVAIFGVNASMILFGLLQEKYEDPGGGWMPFWFGTIAGAVPWVVIGIFIWSPTVPESPPAFVYAIFVTLFVFFNSFAVNMVLQYRRTGRWRDYAFGEFVYVLLSLTAKSALAWQVFAGALAA
ncbi:MAG: heliorhodopsin HeR [Acidimicrobiia bacterium]|nr:heliorhodopsin HeR [Acidimicrobiia bacterium]